MKPSLLNRYNHPETILVISSFPSRGSIHTGGGLASYTQNTLQAIKKNYPRQKIIVLANIEASPEIYHQDGLLIIRCWRRNQLSLYFQLLRHLQLFSQAKSLLIGFEFAAYGEFWITALFPSFLATTRLLGKFITIVVHQVIANLTHLSPHIGLKNQPLRLALYNRLLRLYYLLLNHTTHQVVILEDRLTRRFNRLVGSPKAIILPHGVNPQKKTSHHLALRRLGLDPHCHYVLAFGYLSHYKGSDLAAQAFNQPLEVNGQPVKLILAGGESPTQGHKPHSRRFYRRLWRLTTPNSSIITPGFIPPQQLKYFFSAADLAIFPYRLQMSASGPLALALAYRLPILTSPKLKDYSLFHCANRPATIRQSIARLLASSRLLTMARAHSAKLASDRDFTHQADPYLQLLSVPDQAADQALPSYA